MCEELCACGHDCRMHALDGSDCDAEECDCGKFTELSIPDLRTWETWKPSDDELFYMRKPSPFVQIKNPRSGLYVKIDRDLGTLDHKETPGSFDDVPVLEPASGNP